MNFIRGFFDNYLKWISIPQINIISIIEIILMVFVLFKIFSNIKDSRTWTIIKGICVLVFFYIIASIFNFYVIKAIFESSIYFVIIGIIIIFSTDIKKLLENIGNKNISKSLNIKSFIQMIKKENQHNETEKKQLHSIKEIAKATRIMSNAKTGALILFEKNSSLSEYDLTGIPIDAKISSQLIVNIFEHNTPLHDGAMIIRNNRILSATCYLPLSDNNEINKNLGTRHRAAIGASEATDCIVLVVSEETGGISICQNGIIKKVPYDDIENTLKEYLIEKEIEEIKTKFFSKKKFKKNWKSICLSIVVGFSLWVTIFNYKDPSITKEFTLPVTITNESSISSLNQTFEIVEGDTVTFSVSGKNSVVKNLNEDNFRAIADLSKLSYVYAVPIEIRPNVEANLDINIIKNDTLKIKLDEIIEADIEVTCESVGNVAKGFKIKELIPEISTISIKGPKSKISKIKNAIVTVDVDNLSKNTTQGNSFVIYDKNGDTIDVSDCIINQQIINVDISLYETKSVLVNVHPVGTPTNNYKLKNYTVNLSNILIAGEKNELNKISEINIDLDITGINSNTTKILNLKDYLPENIELVDEDIVFSVDLELEGFQSKKLKIKSSDIVIKNLKSDYICTVEDLEWEVSISALKETLTNLNIGDLKPYIDATNLEEGEYNLNLQFEDVANVTISEPPSIEIIIEKKK